MRKKKENQKETTQKTEILPVELEERELQLLLKKADILIKSKLLPSHIENPEQVVVLFWKAKELGLPPMEAINTLYIINQKVSIMAQGMLSLIYKSNLWDEIEISDIDEVRKTMKAYCYMKRKGAKKGFKATFSLEDAQKAGLLFKDNWKKYPAEMLLARAISTCAKKVFPDLLGGLYAKEELEDLEPSTPTIIKVEDGKIIETQALPQPEPAQPEPAQSEPAQSQPTEQKTDTNEETERVSKILHSLDDLINKIKPYYPQIDFVKEATEKFKIDFSKPDVENLLRYYNYLVDLQNQALKEQPKITYKQKQLLYVRMKEAKKSEDEVKAFIREKFQKEHFSHLTGKELDEVLKWLRNE